MNHVFAQFARFWLGIQSDVCEGQGSRVIPGGIAEHSVQQLIVNKQLIVNAHPFPLSVTMGDELTHCSLLQSCFSGFSETGTHASAN